MSQAESALIALFAGSSALLVSYWLVRAGRSRRVSVADPAVPVPATGPALPARTIRKVLDDENEDVKVSRVLFDLVYILVSIAVLLWWVSGRIAQEDRRYTSEFVGDVLAAAHSVPWWALIPFVPPVLRVSLNDWSADSPMMALARLCDQWSKVAYWFAVVVMVIASVSGAIALVSAASVKGVLVVIAALLVILVLKR